MNPPQDRTDYAPPNSLNKRALVGGPVNAVGIDAAMALANAPVNAVLGPDTQDVPTNKTPVVPGQELQLGVDAPIYGWNPGQEGFGQGRVNQIQVDGFNTPVATKNFGYGAIAARQQGLAERKQQLADAKSKLTAGYDPFKNISDPFAPYTQEFNGYVRDQWGQFIQDHIDSGEFTDAAEVNTWLATTPEGKAALEQWAGTMDAIAKENKGMGDRELDVLAKVQEGKQFLEPDEYNAMVNSLSAKDRSGAPVKGTRGSDFVERLRKSEAVLSKIQYRDQFLTGLDKMAEQISTIMPVQRLPGGKYVLPEEERQNFDAFIEAEVPAVMEMRIFKNEAEAKKALKGWLTDKFTFKTTLYEPHESVERKEAAKAKGQARQSSGWGYAERSFMADARVGGSKDPNAQFEFIAAPNETQSGGAQVISPKPTKLFDPNTPQGVMVMITGFSKPASGGDWLVLGERVDSKIIDDFNQWRQSKSLGPVNAGDLESPETSAVFETWAQNFKTTKGRPYQARLSNNRSQVAAKYGTADPYGFTEVPQAVAAYNKKYGVQMTTEDFGSLTRAQQEAIVNGKY